MKLKLDVCMKLSFPAAALDVGTFHKGINPPRISISPIGHTQLDHIDLNSEHWSIFLTELHQIQLAHT